MVAIYDTSATVSDQVRTILDAAPLDRAYAEALTAALTVQGNILSNAPRACWARLLWICCIAAGGRWEQAAPAAAAVELFMTALDLLDDAEDGEAHLLHAVLGPPRALNASTGLLLLAQQTLLGHVGSEPAAMLLDAGLRACCGQHADLVPGDAHPVSLDEALAVTARKSASLVAGICGLGALVAGASDQAQTEYTRFGWYIGMLKQLANDMAAIGIGATCKTDMVLGRPTVPLAYVAAVAGAPASVGAALHSGESVAFTWAIAETYRRQALDLVPHLTEDPVQRHNLASLIDTI